MNDHIHHKLAYGSWSAAKKRCRNPRCKAYKDYGAKGITFSPLWDRFRDFLRDMGDPPFDENGNRMTLDRIDGTKGYEPGNCRWATYAQQSANTKRSGIPTEYKIIECTN